jgi:hypothetical protein
MAPGEGGMTDPGKSGKPPARIAARRPGSGPALPPPSRRPGMAAS